MNHTDTDTDHRELFSENTRTFFIHRLIRGFGLRPKPEDVQTFGDKTRLFAAERIREWQHENPGVEICSVAVRVEVMIVPEP